MPRILVVEDDRDLNRLVCSCLRGEGHDVACAFDGEEALTYLGEGKYDLLLTDIMMPKVDGFDLAEKARLIDKNMPIVFMTAKDDKPSQLLGYRLGIDDYIVKPFDVDVLIMKIGAILRRAKIESEKTITVGNFSMNIEERTALVDGEEIALTVREFDLLFKFLSYPKKTFTRSALMEEFWDFDSSATSRTVDVYMAKLREKTSKCNGFEIQTVHGLGYKAVLK
ncbi:MAG: response regulator transcription factor [Clostridia bacterium]|nr:response regulator transcription factor [Clostridia bacterium]MDE6604986.1 response regulator transcription factor [Clostridia bacterium]MDE6869894.1 response regulator transcription factor [Clostridia bacterium]MDE7208945.1 response regulator transcription factor [Clostridia bacterium]